MTRSKQRKIRRSMQPDVARPQPRRHCLLSLAAGRRGLRLAPLAVDAVGAVGGVAVGAPGELHCDAVDRHQHRSRRAAQRGQLRRRSRESFTKSMQGPKPSASDVEAVVAYLGSLEFPRNPNLGRDGALSESAKRGESVFRSAKAFTGKPGRPDAWRCGARRQAWSLNSSVSPTRSVSESTLPAGSIP